MVCNTIIIVITTVVTIVSTFTVLIVDATVDAQVHLCEAIRINEFLPDEYTLNRTLSRSSMLVAVKMLRPTADDRAR